MSEAAPFVDPRRVVLFSGHRVDPAGRVPPRFPDAKADHAGVLIDRALRDLDIGPGDLALTQGSSGGDLLFAEAAARRGARLRLMQPAPELPCVNARSPGPMSRSRRARSMSTPAWSALSSGKRGGTRPAGSTRWPENSTTRRGSTNGAASLIARRPVACSTAPRPFAA